MTTTDSNVVEYGVILPGKTHLIEVLRDGQPNRRILVDATYHTVDQWAKWIIEDLKADYGWSANFTIGSIRKVES